MHNIPVLRDELLKNLTRPHAPTKSNKTRNKHKQLSYYNGTEEILNTMLNSQFVDLLLNSVAVSPQANYTDGEAAACQRS
jgi:hypothetical protein